MLELALMLKLALYMITHEMYDDDVDEDVARCEWPGSVTELCYHMLVM